MEETLREIVSPIALVIESVAVLIVVLGSLDAFARIVAGLARRTTTHGAGKEIWRRFGMWLLLGLEFALAADIVRSVISPTWEDIGELAAIAAIRTFLNYFLERDLEHVRSEVG